jgi:exonuclease SbcD
VRDRVTFLHVADIHLDAPFQGVVADDERIGRALAEATYSAWRRAVDLALERAVDFVVIAGDAYNAADRSLRAQLRFREQVLRLDAAGIRTFVVHGNHDPANGWSAGLAAPESVHVFSSARVERVEAVVDGEYVCAVYGRSFARAAETESFASGYKREAGDAIAVAVMHANVGGRPDHDPYAPCSVDDLRAAGMDYWALGHVHRYEVVARDPWAVYAGSPQGLNPKEVGVHGCCLVEIARSGAVTVLHEDLAAIDWACAELDVSAAVDIDAVERVVADACGEMRASSGRPLVARIALTGRSPVHADLARPGVIAQLLESFRAEHGAGDPWVWVDRLDDRTSPPIDLDAVRAGQDFAAEIVAVSDELEADPATLRAMVGEVSAPVQQKLSGYATGLGDAELLALARDRCLDELLPGGGAGR